MSSTRFLEELREEVLAAADRQDARRRPRHHGRPVRDRRVPRTLTAAAVAAVVVLGVVVAAAPRGASADVEVIRQGDHLLIKLTDVETRPDEIESAARAAGLDVVVDEVPVGPSNVGRFLGLSATDTIEYLHVQKGNPASPSYGFRVPVDYPGTLRLQLGRPARGDEQWATGSMADARGEVLECGHLGGRSLQDVLSLAQAHGLEGTRVLVLDGPGEIFNAQLPQHLDATVVSATTDGPDGPLVIGVVDDPSQAPPWTHDDPGCD